MLIGTLANHGECWLNSNTGQLTQDGEVEFHGAITRTVPSLNKLLMDKEEDIRWEAMRLIRSLETSSEWHFNELQHG
jgi:hypothetical protein